MSATEKTPKPEAMSTQDAVEGAKPISCKPASRPKLSRKNRRASTTAKPSAASCGGDITVSVGLPQTTEPLVAATTEEADVSMSKKQSPSVCKTAQVDNTLQKQPQKGTVRGAEKKEVRCTVNPKAAEQVPKTDESPPVRLLPKPDQKKEANGKKAASRSVHSIEAVVSSAAAAAATAIQTSGIAVPTSKSPADPLDGAGRKAARTEADGNVSTSSQTATADKCSSSSATTSSKSALLAAGQKPTIPLVATQAKPPSGGGDGGVTSSSEAKPSSTTTAQSITPITTAVVSPAGPATAAASSADAKSASLTSAADTSKRPVVTIGGVIGRAASVSSIDHQLLDGEAWPSALEGAQHKNKRKSPPPAAVTGACSHLSHQTSSSATREGPGAKTGGARQDEVALKELIQGVNCMREQLDHLMERPESRSLTKKADLERLRRQIAQNESTVKRLSGKLRHRSTPAGRDDVASIPASCWRAFEKPKRQQRNKSTGFNYAAATNQLLPPFADSAGRHVPTGNHAAGGERQDFCGDELFRLADGSCSNIFVPGCDLAGEMAGGATIGLTREAATVSVLSPSTNRAEGGGSNGDKQKNGEWQDVSSTGETYYFYDSAERAWIQVMLPPFHQL
eukprot:GHVS01093758.1.p1 GENE.GHVS01093758.1~~GHVS01093758.1.p1  ORF type:complete len:624 (+),score=102.03 GHVS01093758.1:797-2668(+)